MRFKFQRRLRFYPVVGLTGPKKGKENRKKKCKSKRENLCIVWLTREKEKERLKKKKKERKIVSSAFKLFFSYIRRKHGEQGKYCKIITVIIFHL